MAKKAEQIVENELVRRNLPAGGCSLIPPSPQIEMTSQERGPFYFWGLMRTRGQFIPTLRREAEVPTELGRRPAKRP